MNNVINNYYDLKENWFALFLSIVRDISPDKALMRMLPNSNKVKNNNKKQMNKYETFPDADIERMIELKKDMTYKQIANIFNTCDKNIYKHIKKYRPDLIKTGIFNSSNRTKNNNFY